MISLENIAIVVKKNLILENITQNFEAGKCYGVIGRNGAGKSVLFKAIAGLLPPSTGTITVDGKPLTNDFLRDAGIIIETPNFIKEYTALENLQCLADIQKKIDKKKISSTLEEVGLKEAQNKKYKHFSLGMKQRLRIAQAIMEEPKYYILDEAFNGLDESGVKDIHNVIKNLKQANKTILLTSHDERDIEILCDVILKIEGGTIHEI